MSDDKSWDIQKSDALYKISRWGQDYFVINDKGHMAVSPNKDPDGPQIDIAEVVEEMQRTGVQFPAVVRFHDILRSQVKDINKTFIETIEEANFGGTYHGVYPIKVNQLREVVEEVIDAGAKYNHGLEAGSKAELLAVLAHNENYDSLTILNGYKDRDYLKLAMLGRKLGRKIIIVVERYAELAQIMELAEIMNVEPIIGLRAKLASIGSGKWKESSGDRAKFGLSIAEIINAIKYLKSIDKLSCLQLFHFHSGSQLPDIRNIKESITEGARIYAKLIKLGAPIKYFDVGGGVGVDYEGSKSTSNSSINYTLKDYVGDVVYILKQICDLEEVDHPHIISETGRALTAHHSCILMNVFGSIEITKDWINTGKTAGEHVLVQNMRDLLEDLREENYQDVYNDASQKKAEALSAFKLGILALEERGKIETLFWKICQKIIVFAELDEFAPEELRDLKIEMADRYLCNFSIFQSIPDAWAIDQFVPMAPITRLDEEPTNLCTLADITCDSDGKISNFITDLDTNKALPLHQLKDDEDYIIGAFLTGAYQDVMGDMHNLFGRLNEVHVFFDDEDPSDFYIEEIIKGNTSGEVLTMLQYAPRDMAKTIKRALDRRVQRGHLRPREAVALTDFYEQCLESYTYLDT